MTDTFEKTVKYLCLMREKISKLESRELNFDFYLFFDYTTEFSFIKLLKGLLMYNGQNGQKTIVKIKTFCKGCAFRSRGQK